MKKFLTLISAFLFLAGCRPEQTSKLSSKDYPNRQERIDRLRQEIVAPSSFTDAEFELFNVNGFHGQREGGVPGASSWKYCFVVRATPDSVDAWIEGKRTTFSGLTPEDWMIRLQQIRPGDWQASSTPELYKSEDALVIVYRREGIVYKQVVNN